MKIVKLVAENVKKLKAIAIETATDSVIKITGANEQGKTTVLDCIWWALGGTKHIQDQPIREGQDKAKITVDLGDLIVTRSFTKSGSYLEVSNRDGAVYKSPQAILDKLIGELSFDPLRFAKAGKTEAVSMLLKLVDLKVDTAKLNEISGGMGDASTNPIDAINSTYSNVFSVRKSKNADVDRMKKLIESYGVLESVDPVKIADLVAQRDDQIKTNQQNQKERDLVMLHERDVKSTENLIDEVNNQIEALKSQLAQAEARMNDLEDALEVKQEKLAQVKVTVDALKDIDLAEINQKITDAEQTNIKAQKFADLQKAKADFERVQKEAEDYTSKLEAIKGYKEDLIKTANFPLPGLDFGNGGVLYNGLPFEQASSAQKLQVSFAVAMALNPKLRVIRIDDGSLLDSKHMAIIEQMAKEKDYQVWMEVVDETGKVGIYIEDGEIVREKIAA